jgi:hypothetical protein
MDDRKEKSECDRFLLTWGSCMLKLEGGGGVFMRWLWLSILAAVLVALAAVPAMAQPVAPSKSGMVSYIEGEVHNDDQLIPDPIVATFPYMKENGALRTVEGRAEVQMLPGWAMRLGEHSHLHMITNRFIDTRVELVEGSGVVQVPEILKDNAMTVVLAKSAITIAKAGDYHFDASPARLKVFAGEANVKIGNDTLVVGGGKMVNVDGALPTVEKFNKEDLDALDRWSARRGELAAAANASAARQVYDTYGRSAPCYTTYATYVTPGAIPGTTPCVGTLRWNPWYGLWTYIPYGGMVCDPIWGYCYYNPVRVYSTYYAPQIIYRPPPTRVGGGGTPSYQTAAPTSSGYSGTRASAVSSVASSPSAGVGHTASSSASVASSGGGSAASGSRGK